MPWQYLSHQQGGRAVLRKPEITYHLVGAIEIPGWRLVAALELLARETAVAPPKPIEEETRRAA